jgi:hypothetical protein
MGSEKADRICPSIDGRGRILNARFRSFWIKHDQKTFSILIVFSLEERGTDSNHPSLMTRQQNSIHLFTSACVFPLSRLQFPHYRHEFPVEAGSRPRYQVRTYIIVMDPVTIPAR